MSRGDQPSPERARERGRGETTAVPESRSTTAGERVVQASPHMTVEQFVSAQAEQQGSPGRLLEKGREAVAIRREQRAAPSQLCYRDGTDEIQFVADFDHHMALDAEMGQHGALPPTLVRGGRPRKPHGDCNWRLVAVAFRRPHRGCQHKGRVSSARKRHAAW